MLPVITVYERKPNRTEVLEVRNIKRTTGTIPKITIVPSIVAIFLINFMFCNL
jgi:hypothetical protein